MGAIESAGIGAIQGKKDREAEAKANRDLTRRMEASGREYAAMRPANSLARRYAAQNIVGLYEPANAMLGEMMGRGPGNGPINLQQATQRWPDMIAARQQSTPMPTGTVANGPITPQVAPQTAAGGWGGVAGVGQRPDPYQDAINARIAGTQKPPANNRGGR
jgi:hypothetical protein